MDLRNRDLGDGQTDATTWRGRAGRRWRAAMRKAVLASLVVAPAAAWAQLLTVPQMGIAGDWVKRLEIRLDSDWEWVQTAEDRVFFATRLGATRKDDIVTMWIRVEFRDPQPAGKHLSVAEKDEWDCRTRKRSTLVTTLHGWNNLQDTNPNTAAAALRTWESVPKGTVGEALLEFACSIHPPAQMVAPAVPSRPPTGKAGAPQPAR